jgi:hypothetical protein
MVPLQRLVDVLLLIWLLAALVPCFLLVQSLSRRYTEEVVDRVVLWYWCIRHARKYTNP